MAPKYLIAIGVLSLPLYPQVVLASEIEDSEKGRTNFQVELMAEALLEGSFNAEEELLAGAQLKYFLTEKHDFRPFLSMGFLTDTENEGSTLDIFNIDLGTQYDLFTFWNNRSYLELGLGLTSIHQEFSTRLIEREAQNSFHEFGYKASFAWGFEFGKSFGTKLFMNSYDGDSRTAGLAFSYAF